MADDKAQEEPSVEEILASIRRIISEDGAAGELDQEGAESSRIRDAAAGELDQEGAEASRTRDDAAARDAAGEDEDVLELTEMVTDDGTVVSLAEAAAAEEGEPPSAPEGKEQAAPPRAAAEGKPEQDEQEQREEPAGAEGEEALVAPSAGGGEELISEAVAGISTDAFAALAEALTRERRTSDAAGLGEADRAIEQVVREELRPLLKEWLDRNLPSVVERLVKQELERMASRARDR